MDGEKLGASSLDIELQPKEGEQRIFRSQGPLVGKLKASWELQLLGCPIIYYIMASAP